MKDLLKIKSKKYKKENKYFIRSSIFISVLLIFAITLQIGAKAIINNIVADNGNYICINMYDTTNETEYINNSSAILDKYSNDQRIISEGIIYKGHSANDGWISGDLQDSVYNDIIGFDPKYQVLSDYFWREKSVGKIKEKMICGQSFDSTSYNEVLISKSAVSDYENLEALIGKKINLNFNGYTVRDIVIKGIFNQAYCTNGILDYIFTNDVIEKCVETEIVSTMEYGIRVQYTNGLGQIILNPSSIDNLIAVYNEFETYYPNFIESDIRSALLVKSTVDNISIVTIVISIFLFIISIINLIVNQSRYMEKEKEFIYFLRRLGASNNKVFRFLCAQNIIAFIKAFLISFIVIFIMCYIGSTIYSNTLGKYDEIKYMILPPAYILIPLALILLILVIGINYLLYINMKKNTKIRED